MSLQELAHFTDITIYCGDNGKVHAHGSVMLRHCPQLRMIAAKFSCCYCHGTDCGGCERNGNLMSLSMPDFSKATVSAFVELIYTGRTFFMNNNEYEKVVDLGKHLGFAVPPAGLSFVHGDTGETDSSPMQNPRLIGMNKKRKSIDSSTPLGNRKRSRTGDESNENNDLNVTPLPFKCSICHRNFNSKYLLKKHAKDCYELPLIPESAPPAPQEVKAEEEGGKKECEKCGDSFAIQGGWITKHQRICSGSQRRKSQDSANGSDIEKVEKKECPNCGKILSTKGGVFTKHMAFCQTNSDNNEATATMDTSASNACPKCGKTYA